MRDNTVFIAYYLYALAVITLSGYVVFILDHSGWWFVLTALFLSNTPSFKSKSE